MDAPLYHIDQSSGPEFLLGQRGASQCPQGYKLVMDDQVCYGRARDALHGKFINKGCHGSPENGCLAVVEGNVRMYITNCDHQPYGAGKSPVCFKEG